MPTAAGEAAVVQHGGEGGEVGEGRSCGWIGDSAGLALAYQGAGAHATDVPAARAVGWHFRRPRRGAGGGAINGAMAAHPIRILGIDPGLRRTGWGLIEADGNRLIYVACGSLETSERAAARRAAGGDP